MVFVISSLTLLIIYLVLNSISFTRLVEDVMAKEEFNQIFNSFEFQLSDHSESMTAVIEEKFRRSAMPTFWDNRFGILDEVVDDINDTTGRNRRINASSMSKFMSQVMFAYDTNEATFHQFGFHITNPNGTMYGTYSLNYSVLSTTVRQYIQEFTTDFLFSEYQLKRDNKYIDLQDDYLGTYAIYDPRCRDWYINAFRTTFEGTFEEAFPIGNDNFNWFYEDGGIAGIQTECVDAKEAWKQLFDLEARVYQDSNITNITEYYSASNVTLHKQSDIAWTQYVVVAAEPIVAITGAIMIQNETTGEAIAVADVDY